jgi:hypothetical protein
MRDYQMRINDLMTMVLLFNHFSYSDVQLAFSADSISVDANCSPDFPTSAQGKEERRGY